MKKYLFFLSLFILGNYSHAGEAGGGGSPELFWSCDAWYFDIVPGRYSSSCWAHSEVGALESLIIYADVTAEVWTNNTSTGGQSCPYWGGINESASVSIPQPGWPGEITAGGYWNTLSYSFQFVTLRGTGFFTLLPAYGGNSGSGTTPYYNGIVVNNYCSTFL